MGAVTSRNESRGHMWRSRWAAIGAAVAVTLGAGGLVAVQAASSPASSVITIDPVRILDTRTDVGLPGPFESPVSQKLQVTGGAVPSGATGVLLNVTVVAPTAAGFVSIRPGDSTGEPSTSSLNFNASDIVPNAVQVGLPTTGANAGQIDITYDAYGAAGPSTEILIDVVGYMVAGGGASGVAGPAGPQGPAGAAGPAGPAGTSGLAPIDRFTPTQLVEGAVLTCASTDVGPTSAGCFGMKLNGLDVRNNGASSNAICNVVTGAGFASWSAANTSAGYLSWDGAKWVYGTGTIGTLINLFCRL